MKAIDRRFHHLSNFLGSASGLGLIYTKYFVKPDPNSFSNIGSPYEAWFHDSHVVLVPLLVFACGMLWHHHISPMLRHFSRDRHGLVKVVSGFAMSAMIIPMIVSGYLVQTSVDDRWRKLWVAVHVVSSVLWVLASAFHILKASLRKTAISANVAKPAL